MYIFYCFIFYWFSLCSSKNPNFVFILTDDQDLLLNGMLPMKNTIKLIANKGITFTNAFVNTPICCPSRSTILVGKYQHNTGVRNNSLEGNCSSVDWQTNHEPYSISALLKEAKGYNTFYAGKYLNQYGAQKANGVSHVPNGYDWWIGLKGNSKYYNYTLSINGTKKYYQDDYLTDVINNFSMDFLNQNHIRKNPFFMTIAPPAAHAPFIPAPRHTNAFPDFKVIRTPSFNYTTTNKHFLMQLPPIHLPENVTILDKIQRNRMRTLLAVDEMVKNIYKKIKSLNIIDNTYFIFTSDHGFHIGQFGQPWDKRQLYETDVRVPFMMSGPRILKNTLTSYPISSVDLAPTILDLADVFTTSMDGESFKNYLFDPNLQFTEKKLLVEYEGEGNSRTIDKDCSIYPSDNFAVCSKDNWCKCEDSKNNTYQCIRHFAKDVDFKFCQFDDDLQFVEAYNLENDPYELNNIYQKMDKTKINYYEQILNKARSCEGLSCKNI